MKFSKKNPLKIKLWQFATAKMETFCFAFTTNQLIRTLVRLEWKCTINKEIAWKFHKAT